MDKTQAQTGHRVFVYMLSTLLHLGRSCKLNGHNQVLCVQGRMLLLLLLL